MTWTTRDEQSHIDGLGGFRTLTRRWPRVRRTGRDCGVESNVEHTLGDERTYTCKLLEGYLRGCKRRHSWGEIDSEVVAEHARRRLAKIRAQLNAETQA